MKKKKLTSSVLVVTLLALSLTGCGGDGEKKSVETQQEIAEMDSVIDTFETSNLIRHSDEAGKEETVYVIMDANGAGKEVIVSEWLKNPEGTATITDTTTLGNIEVVKGNATYSTGEDNSLTWSADGQDVYYQGTTDRELPVDVMVHYTLDGQPVDASMLQNVTGHITVTYDYNNKIYRYAQAGEDVVKIYQPFTTITGLMLDDSKVANVKVTDGKVINSGDFSIVFGIAMPGLKESLGLDDVSLDINTDDINIPDSVTIEADVCDFTMPMAMTVVSNNALSTLSLDNINSIEDLKNKVAELSDGMDQLIDGSGKLADGMNDLQNGTGDLKNGTNELQDGADKLNNGAHDLADGARKVNDGAGQLSQGTADLHEGTKKLKDGLHQLSASTPALSDGVAAISNGADQVAAGSAVLDSKKDAIIGGASQLSGGLDQVNGGLDQVEGGLAQLQSKLPIHTSDDVDATLTSLGFDPADDTNPQVAALKQLLGGYVTVSQTIGSAPTDPATGEGGSGLRGGVGQVKAGVGQVKTGAGQLKDGLDEYTTGVAQVNGGIQQLKAGANELNSKVPTLSQGVMELCDGVDRLESGACTLRNGASDLYSGTQELSNGANDLANGTGDLYNGTTELNDGVDKLTDGVSQLVDGAGKLNDGVIELNDEGISKITDLVNNDLEAYYDRLCAIRDFSNEYTSFTGSTHDSNSTVKFIYKINAADSLNL